LEPDLTALLESLDLAQYLQVFASEGYDKLADVRRMTVEEMTADIGMKKGHAKRLAWHLASST
jgi:hypothetical protein